MRIVRLCINVGTSIMHESKSDKRETVSSFAIGTLSRISCLFGHGGG